MSLLITTLLDTIKKEFSKKEPKWNTVIPNRDDMLFLKNECNVHSDFDPLKTRQSMFNKMENNELHTILAQCDYGQIFVLFENSSQKNHIPWGLWGRILRIFYEKSNKKFKIYFLASSHLRKFPSKNEHIRPQHINGGYTYHCNPETIMIYRAEDATRVLIHELMHSCCLDKMENGVDIVEAETEAWAELIYITLLSRGDKNIFYNLLQKQSTWIQCQNQKVKKYMNNPNSMEFPWRYTIGKENVWRRWNILQNNLKCNIGNSLRLTYPPNDYLKEIFGVDSKSTIL